ncbi:MAG TPA: flotillin family protein, partial [Vicinamibacteria bacterium]|nr:flotillin family protein [Vicinamibacteria bacterium]
MTTLFASFVLAHPLVSALVVLLLLTAPVWLGVVVIGERQVGVVVKKFARRALPVGRLVALDGEAGYQAETLPPGVHFAYWRWQYAIAKAPVTVIPQGEIGLVVAADGKAMGGERILGRCVRCNAFQDARAFLTGGGEKGRQLAILTAGTYRINTALFEVITRQAAAAHGMTPDSLRVHRIEADRVGIV